jgi:hypothetical protein
LERAISGNAPPHSRNLILIVCNSKENCRAAWGRRHQRVVRCK